MTQYRNRTTGEILSESDVKRNAQAANIGLPKVWKAATLDSLDIDPVLKAPKPTPSHIFKTVRRNGVTQDGNGNWVEAYVEADMYVTDVDGTKAEKEAEATLAYAASLKNTVKGKANTNMDAGTTVSGIEVDTDLNGRTLALGAMIGDKANRKWVLKDGSTVVLSKVQVDALSAGIDDYIQSVFDKRAVLNDAIEAVKTDIAALQAIDIDTGWPT
jgi:hypothetical protein